MSRTPSTTPAARKDEWGTPAPFVTALALRERVAFGLDPWASHDTAKAGCYFTPERGEDGFALPWNVTPGVPVFAFGNPPYSGDHVPRACEKAYEESIAHEEEVTTYLLLPAATGTRWWHRWAPRAWRKIYIQGRIAFEGAGEHGPEFDSVLLVFSRFWGGPTEDYWAPTPRERGRRGGRVTALPAYEEGAS